MTASIVTLPSSLRRDRVEIFKCEECDSYHWKVVKYNGQRAMLECASCGCLYSKSAVDFDVRPETET